MWETIRNITLYGISAPGEFRFRYLILVIPFYVALYFLLNTRERNSQNFCFFAPLIFPFYVFPLLGSLKGWVFGANENRLFPLIFLWELCMLFCLSFLQCVQTISNGRKILLWLIAIPVFVVLLVDGHRSVWLASGVIIITLIALSEMKVTKYLWMLIPLFLFVIFIASQLGISIFDFIAERTVAFLTLKMTRQQRGDLQYGLYN